LEAKKAAQSYTVKVISADLQRWKPLKPKVLGKSHELRANFKSPINANRLFQNSPFVDLF